MNANTKKALERLEAAIGQLESRRKTPQLQHSDR